MHNCSPRRFVLAASILALVAPSVSADILDQYTFGSSAPGILTPTTVATGIVASPITGDTGVNLDVTSNQSNPPPTTPWLRVDPKAPNTTATAAIAAAADFKFTLSTLPGFTLNLSSLSFDVARGGTSSTRGYAVQSSVDNFVSTISTADVAAVRPTFVNVPIDLSAVSYQNLSSITFKIFSYSGGSGQTVEYDNITVNGASTFSGYTWQGGSSTWDTVAANWTGPQTVYVDNTAGSKVLFSDAGATGNVNVTQAGLNPNLITFTNTSAKEYTFNGGNLNIATSLFKSGDGNTTFNNTVSAGSVTADTGALIVGATGKLNSADITVSPTGSLSVASGGVLGATGTLTVNGLLALNNATQSVNSLSGASTGNIYLSGTALELSGTSTYAGMINGDGSLKVAGGTVTLSGANGYSGDTTVAGGALQLNNVTAAGYGKITVNNGGTLSLGAGVSNAITLAGGSTLGVSAGVTSSADVTVSGTSTIKTFNPITGATPNDLIVMGMLQGSGDLNIVSINGNLPDGAAFRLRGLNSTGDNAYRGTITVGQSGKFELQFADTAGSPMGTGKLVVTGGTTSTTNAGTFSIVNVRNNSIGSATLGNNVEVTGVGSSYFNMLGSAPTGSSVNFGDLRIGDGQTIAAVSSTTGTGPYTLSFASVHLTGGNATFSPRPTGNSSYTGENNISLGPITENVAGSGIIMNGAATLTLTGNSNYTGATVVNSGTLVVDGNISGSAVAVNGGTLRGAGTTGPLTVKSGTLAPGNGLGSLTTGSLTLDTGSTLAIEIGGNTVGSYDQINVVGGLSLNALVTLVLDFSTYDPVDGDSFILFNNDLNDAVAFGSDTARFVFGSTQLNEGTVFTATSGAFTQDFRITYAGGSNGNDIVLTAVPEPGTATTLLLGLGMLAGSPPSSPIGSNHRKRLTLSPTPALAQAGEQEREKEGIRQQEPECFGHGIVRSCLHDGSRADQQTDSAAVSDDDARWTAVMHRDRTADGVFYYSVRTTGVYCRPSCASRLARRENVSFYSAPVEAEQAGFRPCKRCRPNELALSSPNAAAVTKACRLIEEAFDLPDLDTLAAAAGMSRFHFHRVFKAMTGLTPKAYAASHRAQRMREELPRSNTVTEAIYGAGFNSNGRFYAASSKMLGMTPAKFRSGGGGETIRFAVGQCSLGSILVAATGQGVCCILLGDDPEALIRDLQDRFRKAELIGGDREFEQLVAKVVGFVEAPWRGCDLPLHIQGTAFQQRVWKALTGIPAGSTLSYTELAERIGAPRAVRAVASACAANALAVAIPCHRVVRSDGGLSGYRWGVERKRALLQREAKA